MAQKIVCKSSTIIPHCCLPEAFESIANQIAAGMLQEQRDPRAESQRTIMGKQMLDDYMDQSTSSRGESYHIRFVSQD